MTAKPSICGWGAFCKFGEKKGVSVRFSASATLASRKSYTDPIYFTGRVVAQRMNEFWGQPVVVDNRPGAGGN